MFLILKIPLRRIALLLLPLITQLFYLPLNRFQSGGIAPSIFLDEFVPIIPVWAIPYLLAIPYWVIMYLWAGSQMSDDLFYPFVYSSVAIILVGQLSFFFFPTYVIRPSITQIGWEYNLLRWIYTNDQAYNALPSGHAYISTMIFLFWCKWKPHRCWLWGILLSVILLSTLFTGQHYLLDLIAGCALSLIGFVIALKLLRDQNINKSN